MRRLKRIAGLAIGLAVGSCAQADVGVGGPTGDAAAERLIAQSKALRADGRLELAIEGLTAASQQAATPAEHARAVGELGATLFLAHRYDDATPRLHEAYDALAGAARAPYAVDLGNLALVRHQNEVARLYYEEGARAGDDPVRFSAELNLARLAEPNTRLGVLAQLSSSLAGLPDPHDRARFGLNLGDQAAALGGRGLAIAYAQFTSARALSDQLGDARLSVEARDALARLYEDQHRDADALVLTREALLRVARASPGSVADLLITLDWREARVLRRQGASDEAIAAYWRTVEAIQAVRQDMPITYEDGQSSFSATLEPVYLELVDLLLQRAAQQSAAAREHDLHAVKDLLELLKQAEMQDYLGDRCTVDAVRAASTAPKAGTAFLYPILLPDRTELLLETASGIVRATVPIGHERMERSVRQFAEALRSDAADFRPQARELYDWLIAPLETPLKEQGVETLVVASDGVLRLVPIGALYDGNQFVIQRFATATVTGLSMTNASPPPGSRPGALVAGLSSPGPVVARLRSFVNETGAAASLSSTPARSLPPTRALLAFARNEANVVPDDELARANALEAERVRLALPGVQEEVDALAVTLHASELLNADFTSARFRNQASSGDYPIVHIASHGYFGGSAQDSFILTYDDLLTLGDLQSLLQSQGVRAAPIELLSLSACETAEGNERSPLGISGAAMKARAKSVLGTLWPVSDQAARTVMEQFYTDLESGRYSKAEALRAAQLELLAKPDTAHPFYWAPFVLIGNWL
jgi:CHAT domain-containing protein